MRTYIVSREPSAMFAVEDKPENVEIMLGLMGYGSIAEYEEDYDPLPEYTVWALAEELSGDVEEMTDLYAGEFLDHDGNILDYDDISDYAEESLNENFGYVELASGSIIGHGSLLREFDPIAFRCIVSDEIGETFYGSWEDWHDAVN